ncbi:MAG TPA: hypothetical protein VFA78_03875, partial [Chloroflexota bacterium]|nr:hypothetical protein [Chloroflexota bacterium]
MLNKLIVTAAVVALALGSGLGFGQHVASASSSKNFSHFFDGPGATYVVMSGTFGYDGYSNVWDLSNGGSCVFSGSENGNWNLGQEQPGQQKGSFYFT